MGALAPPTLTRRSLLPSLPLGPGAGSAGERPENTRENHSIRRSNGQQDIAPEKQYPSLTGAGGAGTDPPGRGCLYKNSPARAHTHTHMSAGASCSLRRPGPSVPSLSQLRKPMRREKPRAGGVSWAQRQGPCCRLVQRPGNSRRLDTEFHFSAAEDTFLPFKTGSSG